MLRNLIAFCIARRPLVLVTFLAFLGVGFAAFMTLNIEAYPDPAPPIIELIAQWPGQSPEEVERYVTIPLEITVNKPAAEVWARVGKYCDIAEWLQVPACTILSGKDGEVGAVRSIGNEILVGKTEYSYTYTQPVREGRPYNLYHGTLEVRPLTATTSKIYYTLLYDNSMLADDAARERDKAQRTASFTRAIQNMKTLAEGGTLPPPPARSGRGR